MPQLLLLVATALPQEALGELPQSPLSRRRRRSLGHRQLLATLPRLWIVDPLLPPQCLNVPKVASPAMRQASAAVLTTTGASASPTPRSLSLSFSSRALPRHALDLCFLRSSLVPALSAHVQTPHLLAVLAQADQLILEAIRQPLSQPRRLAEAEAAQPARLRQ